MHISDLALNADSLGLLVDFSHRLSQGQRAVLCNCLLWVCVLCAPCLGYVIRVGHGSPQTTASSSTPESISSPLGGGFSHKSADASAECSHFLLWSTWFPVLSNESLFYISFYLLCFPRSSVGKESACNAGDLGSVTWSGRYPGGGRGNPLQYSCLENPSLFISLSVASLGLCCCRQAFSSVENGHYSLGAGCGLLTAVAPLVVERGLWGAWASVTVARGLRSVGSWSLDHRLSSCGIQAELLQECGIFPAPGSNLCLLHWQKDSLTTESPEKPQESFLMFIFIYFFGCTGS